MSEMTLICECWQGARRSVTDLRGVQLETEAVAGWTETVLATGTSTLTVQAGEIRHQAPYADLVYQALRSLPKEVPDLPCEADDAL